jgi:hypothetical protein
MTRKQLYRYWVVTSASMSLFSCEQAQCSYHDCTQMNQSQQIVLGRDTSPSGSGLFWTVGPTQNRPLQRTELEINLLLSL